jgi:WD40 repeat protein
MKDAFILHRINPPTINDGQPRFISYTLASNDGLIASGDDFGGVRIWSVETGEELALIEFDYQPLQVAFTPNGAGLIVVLSDGTIRLLGVP